MKTTLRIGYFDTRTNEQSIVVNGTTYIREEDTFDTWFSSGQWPYIVTDYLDGGDLANYFPTDMMETGMDIMRAWVSRMIMLSLYRTGKLPFQRKFIYTEWLMTSTNQKNVQI